MVSVSTRKEVNRLAPEDRQVHDWYRFVLAFPPTLVRAYLSKFGADENSVVLDPFCGTGTTLVECKKLGLSSYGIEANPICHFATSVKTCWEVRPDRIRQAAETLADQSREVLKQGQPSRTLPDETFRLLVSRSISPGPLHQTLVLLDQINLHRDQIGDSLPHLSLALARILPTTIGNVRFGPEVGVGPAKGDVPVLDEWTKSVASIASDIESLQRQHPWKRSRTVAVLNDSRQATLFPDQQFDVIITSPPYPNEKDYSRATRLESVLLGFTTSRQNLTNQKKMFLRSNSRGVYKGDSDHLLVQDNRDVQEIAEEIERRRRDLGKTSGFERQYHRVVTNYFGGMARHLSSLRSKLRPGARLAYVVGDQASYFHVLIRTGSLLAGIAETLGYTVEGIELFRVRAATRTRSELREEVVLLRWP